MTESKQDLRAVQMVAAGYLAGCMRSRTSKPLRVTGVDAPVDENGNYLPGFVVHLASGARLVIGVTAIAAEEDDDE